MSKGMEVAGGILVSQLASAADSKLNEWADFCYIRKKVKTSGTCQQLEGPNEFTKRNSKSSTLYSVWVDDALSTGSSLLEGIQMLKSEYNIDVVSSLYLCDRSKDRQNLDDSKQFLADEVFTKSKIYAIYDLNQIDSFVKK
jgi:orotate phosphoribosyltransferase